MKRLSSLAPSMILVAAVPATGAAAPVPQKITITMTDFQFAPKTVALKPGTAVELLLVNKGSVQHEFMLYPVPGGMTMDMDKYGADNTYFQGIGPVEVAVSSKPVSRVQRLDRVLVDPGQSVTIRFPAQRRAHSSSPATLPATTKLA